MGQTAVQTRRPLDSKAQMFLLCSHRWADFLGRVRMREDRFVRLLGLQPHEVIAVRCRCGRSLEYGYGLLQRLHRLPSDTLIYDLQFKLHCWQRDRRSGFKVGIRDGGARKSVVKGTSVSVRVDLGGRRTLKKKKNVTP